MSRPEIGRTFPSPPSDLLLQGSPASVGQETFETWQQ